MSKRPQILAGMALGAAWAIAVVWVGVTQIDIPIFTLLPALAFAFFGPGVFLLLVIGRLAQRRFFDDAIIDGDPLSGAAEIDQRVLSNTVEQLVLALALWPAIAYLTSGDGPGLVVSLGVGFTLARFAFWIGYHLAPPLRAFGFAATFYPTIAALVWAILTLAI